VQRRVLGNAAWLIADKLARMLLAMLVTAWLARYLGPTRFGFFNFAHALVVLFTLIATLGLDSVVIRDIVREPANRSRILANAFVLRLAAAAIAVALCIVIITILRPGDGEALRLVAVLALSLLPMGYEVIDYSYQADVNARPVVLIRNSVFVFCALVRLAVIVSQAGLITIAATFVLEPVLFAIFLQMRARRDHLKLRLSEVSLADCRHLLAQCWPLMISSASIAIYMRVDQLMLAQIAGDHETGIFSAAVRLSESWYLIPMALMASTAPILTGILQRSREDYERELLRTARVLTGFGLAAALALALAAPIVIHVVYGKGFSASASVLAIHAWAGVFVCLGVISNNWLVNTGNTRYIMYQTVVGALTNVLLNVVLIPPFGAVGAALATVASYCVAAFLCNGLAAATKPAFRIQLRSLALVVGR
jgi:PST family polysaccharide transporter